jgi:hypothetical protein
MNTPCVDTSPLTSVVTTQTPDLVTDANKGDLNTLSRNLGQRPEQCGHEHRYSSNGS